MALKAALHKQLCRAQSYDQFVRWATASKYKDPRFQWAEFMVRPSSLPLWELKIPEGVRHCADLGSFLACCRNSLHHQLVVSTLTSEIVGHACGIVGGRIGRGGATQIIWGDFSRLPAHLTGADHPLWIAKYDDPLLWRLIERSQEPQDASTVLPLNEFWAAGRR